jgi:hypothetical protein
MFGVFRMKNQLQPATPKSGEDPGGGGAHSARPPKIGKDMIFLRKMVIFHTKYPNNFRASLRSAQFFKVRPPPNLKSWIRPWLGAAPPPPLDPPLI